MIFPMRTVILSDTHLRDKFEPAKFNFLFKLLSSVDQIIINGDFFDGHLITFDDFVKSKWSNLFPLMKQKNTIYIYGNHDIQKMSDDRVNLFSMKHVHEYRLPVGDKMLTIMHGHQIVLFGTDPPFYPVTGWWKVFALGYEFLEEIYVRIFGKYFSWQYSIFNNVMKKWAIANLQENEILVTGHIHSAEFNPNKQFINTGITRHGLAQYLLIDDGKMRLVHERY